MADTPKKRRTGRTPEEIEQGGRLIDALCVLFKPFVTAACQPKLEAELAEPIRFSEDVIRNVEEAVKEMPSDLPPELQQGFRDMAEAMKDPKPFTPEETARTVEEEGNNATSQLVRNWLNAYFYAEADADGTRTVAAASIDDAMLPPLDFVLKYGISDSQTGLQLFAECCNDILDADETRAVLRQVKATLPQGKVLPDEAVAFLALECVAIVP